MRLIRRPWIWFWRLRHRRGYGVHSPFAYNFISDVVYERTAFYSYRTLSWLHPWWVRYMGLYPLTCRRMLFRLANYIHPRSMALVGNLPTEQAYLSAAVPSARWIDESELNQGKVDLIFVAREKQAEALALLTHISAQGALVMEGIHADEKALALWNLLKDDARTGVTFDLYTYGILFFNHQLHKQHYIVNF